MAIAFRRVAAEALPPQMDTDEHRSRWKLKPTHRVILFSLLATIVAGLAVYFLRPAEPKYQGKTVREWLEVLGKSWQAVPSKADETSFRLALEPMGTNLFPVLVEEICARNSKFIRALRWLNQRQTFIDIPFDPSKLRCNRACAAAEILSATAQGPPAAAAILQRLRVESDNPTRRNLIFALFSLGPSASAAVPTLLAMFNDGDEETGSLAAFVLGKVGQQVPTAVPALIEALHDKSWAVRNHAAYALRFFGNEAPVVIPALRLIATNDSNLAVRRKAVGVIHLIEHEMQENARALQQK